MLAAVAFAQAPPAPPSVESESAAQLIAHLDQGEVSPRLVGRLVELHATEAVPSLRKAFSSAAKKPERQAIAAGLLALGEQDDQFLNYLIVSAKAVAESDMPFPFLAGPDGKIAPLNDHRNPAFVEWCRRLGLDPDSTIQKALGDDPLDIRYLALTRNQATAPVLLRALASANWFVRLAAADGLAQLGNHEYFDLVVAAAKDAPRELGAGFADSIRKFDLPGAEAAASGLVAHQ
jgi:HEAT repeat protein